MAAAIEIELLKLINKEIGISPRELERTPPDGYTALEVRAGIQNLISQGKIYVNKQLKLVLR